MRCDEDSARALAEGPWNPGIRSGLTRELLSLSTIFGPDNVFNDLSNAIELQGVTGLPLEELAIFRPERLAVHEILVRVTADYEVPDPEDADVSSLGVNFRRMIQTFLAQVVEPGRSSIVHDYMRLRRTVADFVETELHASFKRGPDGPDQHPNTFFRRFWRGFDRAAQVRTSPDHDTNWDRDERILQEWTDKASSNSPPLHAAALRSLTRVAAAIRSKRGRIVGQHAFLRELATDLTCNELGSESIGRLLEPRIAEVAEKQSFNRLCAQEQPVFMVTKGASASGKSTMRPLQRTLAAKLGLQWREFALISPDIWRKVLLDFGSLRHLYKYAGMLTSQELGIIDSKLDAHLICKGRRGAISHLLIDRFRFDTFALDSDEDRHVISRFGTLVCYFFLITSPHATVERAWKRGLEVGRYKAVDDVLAHNTEAYAGMQNILFARALEPRLRAHYEFLDNDVPRGQAPLTAAFGRTGEMNILDIKRMIDICRYQKINLNATSPSEVYPDRRMMEPENNLAFLIRCVRSFPQLNLADRETGRIYAHFAAGRLQWIEPDPLMRAASHPDVEIALRAIAPDFPNLAGVRLKRTPEFLDPARFITIGR
jgi:hypothetical protein